MGALIPMLRTLRLAAVACLLTLLLAAAPLASAQTAPVVSLTFAGQPEKAVVSTKDISLAPMTLTLRIQNVVCSGTATMTAALAATVTPAGNGSANATAVVAPVQVGFTVGPGAFGTMNSPVGVGSPYRSQAQALTVAVTAPGVQKANATVKVTASLPAYTGMSCSAAAAIGAASATAEYQVAYNVTQAKAPEPTQKLPVPLGWTLAGTFVALAFTRRARRA